VVWERVQHHEAVQLHNTGTMDGETNDPSEASELPSPNLADFESFLENMTQNRRHGTASGRVMANAKQDANVPITARDQRRRRIEAGKRENFPSTIILESQPSATITPGVVVVPDIAVAVPVLRRGLRMSIISEGKRHVDSDVGSDSEDCEPIAVSLRKPPKQKADEEIPKGRAAIGLIVARDFGDEGGIFHGRITEVDMEGRRPYYRVTYDDGDEEDFDYEELKFAVEFQQAIALGTYKAGKHQESEGSDGEGSVHIPSEDFDSNESDAIGIRRKKKVPTSIQRQRKRKTNAALGPDIATVPHQKRQKTKASAGIRKKSSKVKHTSESALVEFSAETEYGQSFRGLGISEQKTEVERLNKGAVKGTKEAIKSKLITTKYTQICADKMKEYLIQMRQPVESMFHATPPFRPLTMMSPTFLSVGEWVEVDADRTPGWNSEGGVGVVIAVHDSLADVKYVLPIFNLKFMFEYLLMTCHNCYVLSKVCIDTLG
jgi:hypothetical protein